MPMDLFADKRDRPVVEVEASSLQRTMVVMAWLAVALGVALVARYWPALPAEVPQHFDARGNVDAWGPRGMVLLLPILSLVMIGGISWLMRYPHLYNYLWPITEDNARRQYELANEMLASVQAVAAWMFALLTWEVCRLAVGESKLLGMYFIPVMVLLLFGSVGLYFFRGYRER